VPDAGTSLKNHSLTPTFYSLMMSRCSDSVEVSRRMVRLSPRDDLFECHRRGVSMKDGGLSAAFASPLLTSSQPFRSSVTKTRKTDAFLRKSASFVRILSQVVLQCQNLSVDLMPLLASSPMGSSSRLPLAISTDGARRRVRCIPDSTTKTALHRE
jgi:hypothetical protein